MNYVTMKMNYDVTMKMMNITVTMTMMTTMIAADIYEVLTVCRV